MKFGIASRLALLLAIVGILAAGLTGFYAYNASSGLLVQSAKDDLLTSTQVLARRILLAREEIERNAGLLASHPAARAVLQDGGPLQLEQLATLFGLVMEVNPSYFQTRLISAADNGMERVRIDRDGSLLVQVTGDDLQEKGHFPYVFDTLKLSAGDTYVSRIFIKQERGAHSGLGKPTIQLAKPVTAGPDKVLGLVVIDVDLDGMFALLAADLPADFQLFLANASGDFLIHPDPAQTFGFDRGRRVLIQDEFAGTRALVEGKVEQVLIDARDGPYKDKPVVAAFIGPKGETSSDGRGLILGLAQPLASVLAQADRLGAVTLRIVLGLSFACMLLAALVARAVTRPINSMSAAVERFTDQRGAEGLPLQRQDEIGVLARSFSQLRDQIQRQLAELERSRRELEHLAQHDPLTGLPNRALFADRVEQALAVARRDSGRLALMFIDLDRFKPVNDNQGHAAGDRLLKELAGRIRGVVRESDTAARIGGDEFVVLLHNIQQDEDALTVGEKIRLVINQPFLIEGQSITVSASIGISLYPEDGADLLELSKHADEAMYRAKESGLNTVALFNPPVGHR